MPCLNEPGASLINLLESPSPQGEPGAMERGSITGLAELGQFLRHSVYLVYPREGKRGLDPSPSVSAWGDLHKKRALQSGRESQNKIQCLEAETKRIQTRNKASILNSDGNQPLAQQS